MKRCTKCGEEKAFSSFTRRHNRPSGAEHQSWCKTCVASRNKRKRAENPSAYDRHVYHGRRQKADYAKTTRGYKLRTQYNMTLADEQALLEKQSGCCAICRQYLGANGERKNVDHRHSDNRVRGLLCRKCNWGLGMFNDSSELLEQAAEYLRQ